MSWWCYWPQRVVVVELCKSVPIALFLLLRPFECQYVLCWTGIHLLLYHCKAAFSKPRQVQADMVLKYHLKNIVLVMSLFLTRQKKSNSKRFNVMGFANNNKPSPTEVFILYFCSYFTLLGLLHNSICI